MIKKNFIYALALIPATTSAQNSTIYRYDALGRLVEVQSDTDTKTTYDLDKAGNRINVRTVNQFNTFWNAAALLHNVGYADGDGWAVNTSTPQGHMIYGPYTNNVPSGNRVGTFKISIDDNSAYDPRDIVHIDVHDATNDVTLAAKILTRKDWISANTYQIFELPFIKTSATAEIEFRIWHYQHSYVRVQKVGFY